METELTDIRVTENTVANIESAKLFLLKNYSGQPCDVVNPIIDHDIRDYFKFSSKDSVVIKQYWNRIVKEAKEAEKEAKKKAASKTRMEEYNAKLQARVEAWKETSGEDKIKIKFDIVADTIKRLNAFFVMSDTQEFYIYQNGVYANENTELTMKKIIRDTYKRIYSEVYKEKNGENPTYVEEPNRAYTAEVLEKLRIDRKISRDGIDAIQQKNKNIINLQNGVYDVVNGEFSQHDPKYLFIRQIPVIYDPKASCPHITKFLSEVVSEEDRQVLIEFAGYCLIPDTRIQKAFMLYGEGSNGKSIFLRLLEIFIGSKNVANESLQHLEEDKFSVANLYGKLVNIYPDLKNSILAHDNIFKSITGGDTLRGERKFQNAFEFRNTARLIFSANTRNLPDITKDDFAFFRRWILIEFANQFLDEGEGAAKTDDKNLIQKITTQEELSGFLNIVINEINTVMDNQKFSYTKSIGEVTKLYKQNSSSVSAFCDACVVASEDDTENIDLYKDYEAWAQANGLKVEALNVFSRALRKLGYTNHRPTDYLTGKKKNLWDNIEVDEEKLKCEITRKPVKPVKQASQIKKRPEETLSDIFPANLI